jgi:hypothetical protein
VALFVAGVFASHIPGVAGIPPFACLRRLGPKAMPSISEMLNACYTSQLELAGSSLRGVQWVVSAACER